MSFAAHDFTNVIARLSLHHGDLILIDQSPSPDRSTLDKATWNWLMNYSADQRVALYYQPMKGEIYGIFATPVYHWVAPFDLPTSLRESAFFVEGRPLGTGSDGFRKMLEHIEHDRPKRLFLLGSRYDWNSSWGPGMTPFEDVTSSELLTTTLTRAGTEWLRPGELP